MTIVSEIQADIDRVLSIKSEMLRDLQPQGPQVDDKALQALVLAINFVVPTLSSIKVELGMAVDFSYEVIDSRLDNAILKYQSILSKIPLKNEIISNVLRDDIDFLVSIKNKLASKHIL